MEHMAAMPEVSLRRMTALDVDRAPDRVKPFRPWPRSSFMYEVTGEPRGAILSG